MPHRTRLLPSAAACLLFAAALALWPAATTAQPLGFGPASPLNTNAATDGQGDFSPFLQTDGRGVWIAVWQVANGLSGTLGSDNDILFSRSLDDGHTWSAPAPLNSNAAIDSGSDTNVALATDRAGVWIAVWRSGDSLGDTIGTDGDILYSRSLDAGLIWSDPAPLNSYAATDGGNDAAPTVSVSSSGTWLAVWQTEDSFGGTIGEDTDLAYARSTDGGQSWSAAAPLNTNAAADAGDDNSPSVAPGRDGQWVCVWSSSDTLGGILGGDRDLLCARSLDGGITWSNPAHVDGNAGGDSGSDVTPAIASDGVSRWIAVWRSAEQPETGGDTDIYWSRSDDAGATWTLAAALNSYAGIDTGTDATPRIHTDASGNWLAVWQSNEAMAITSDIGTDNDIIIARSADNGLSWLPAVPLDPRAVGDSGGDTAGSIAADGSGRWMVLWGSSDTFGGILGGDDDIIFTVSSGLPLIPPTLEIETPAADIVVPHSQTDIAFGGTASDLDGAVVAVEWRRDGGDWTAATGTSTWFFVVSGLAEGPTLIDVRARDDDGGESPTVSRTVTRAAPNQAPMVTIVTPAADLEVENLVTSATFAGMASDSDGTIASVQWRRNGGPWTLATGTSVWFFVVAGLEEGENLVEVRAIDNVGVSSPLMFRRVTRETSNTAPTLQVESPAGGPTPPETLTTLDVSGTASDVDGTIEVVEWRANGGEWTPASGTDSWSFTARPLDVGSHTLEVRAIDDRGAESAIAGFTVTRLPAPPVAVVR